LASENPATNLRAYPTRAAQLVSSNFLERIPTLIDSAQEFVVVDLNATSAQCDGHVSRPNFPSI